MSKKRFQNLLALGFLLLVSWLLFKSLRGIRWGDVSAALSRVSLFTLGQSLGVTALIYGILTTYDYLGFRHLKFTWMTYRRVLVSAFICYAFNFNLGAVIGGVGFRYKIYTGWKVARNKVPVIVIFSTLTNWMGYVTMLGLCFFLEQERIGALLRLAPWVLALLGVVCWGMVLTNFWLCAKQKVLKVKDVEFAFPKFRMVFVQVILGGIQWSLPSVVISLFLTSIGFPLPFGEILAIFLLAGLAGSLSHIPAGLGVMEAAYLGAGFAVPAADLLAALLCFRLVYYLIPLFVAVPTYVALEIHQRTKVAPTP